MPAILLLLLAGVATALATPGDLDSSFDGDGIRTVDFNGDDSAQEVLIQPDGKIVAAGSGNVEPEDFVVARLKLDGSLDTSFDGDGKAVADFGAREGNGAAALQPDGKIVIAGDSTGAGGTSDFRILRLTADGSPDPTFDKDGKATIDFGGVDTGKEVLVQPDGKIVVAGSVFGQLAVVRLNSDGSVEGGARRADFGGAFSEAYALALQPDGKIVAAGFTESAGGADDVAVARFNADLSLDSTFVRDGKKTLDLGGVQSAEYASDVAVQPDGKIVLTGEGYNTKDIAVTRLETDGSLDTSFDGDGTARIDLGSSDGGYAVALQANGKIVVGTSNLILRLQPGGALDTTFSGDGKQPLSVVGSVASLALLRDGRIAAAGFTGGNVLVGLFEGDSGPAGTDPGGGGPGGGALEVPRCAGKKATIVGTGKADRLKGTRRADVIIGVGGNDRVDGGRGNDLICAGDGNDWVKGSSGNDRLYGQTGKDTLAGGAGRDALSGGASNDRLAGDAGKDRLAGGPGKDRLIGGSGKDSCNGGTGKDRAVCERRKSL
jgi:uncharacterized delta-60 repeat protein